jgi:hypothetical protein
MASEITKFDDSQFLAELWQKCRIAVRLAGIQLKQQTTGAVDSINSKDGLKSVIV